LGHFAWACESIISIFWGVSPTRYQRLMYQLRSDNHSFDLVVYPTYVVNTTFFWVILHGSASCLPPFPGEFCHHYQVII